MASSTAAACTTSLFLGSTAPLNKSSPPLELRGSSASSSSVRTCTIVASSSQSKSPKQSGRREAVKLAAAMLLAAAVGGATNNANAALVDDLLAKSAANKELNDKKRLATSYANTARAYTVANGTCKFPENFTGCQDLAKKKNVPFLSDDLKLECEGKDKYKCGSNVFWKW